VASLTPATGGMSGKRAGASGEMAGAMASFLCHGRSEPRGDTASGRCDCRLLQALPATTGFGIWAPLAPERQRGVTRIPKSEQRYSVFILLCRLVEPLDLGALAQLGDEVRLHLARQIGLDLVLHLLEFRRLPGTLVLELDDVPAELRLHRIGKLSWIHLEGDV